MLQTDNPSIALEELAANFSLMSVAEMGDMQRRQQADQEVQHQVHKDSPHKGKAVTSPRWSRPPP